MFWVLKYCFNTQPILIEFIFAYSIHFRNIFHVTCCSYFWRIYDWTWCDPSHSFLHWVITQKNKIWKDYSLRSQMFKNTCIVQVTFLKNGTKWQCSCFKNKLLEDGCLSGSHFVPFFKKITYKYTACTRHFIIKSTFVATFSY